MGALKDRVKEAEKLNQQMFALVKQATPDARIEVVRLRGQLSRTIVEILKERSSEPGLQDDPAKAQAFDRLFRDMRTALSGHQGTWQSSDIARDPGGYTRSAAEVHRLQEDFFGWCRNNLT